MALANSPFDARMKVQQVALVCVASSVPPKFFTTLKLWVRRLYCPTTQLLGASASPSPGGSFGSICRSLLLQKGQPVHRKT
jgi:hypothetical protein